MFFDSDPFGDAMFTTVPILVIGGFILIIGIFIFIVIKGLTQWSSNNNSPKLIVPAKVVTKRTSTSGGHHSTDNTHSMTTTSYYATFQFESEDRTEFSLSGSQFGMLAEADIGVLTFQGTRYLGFERDID